MSQTHTVDGPVRGAPSVVRTVMQPLRYIGVWLIATWRGVTNVVLRQLHHTSRPFAELRDEAAHGAQVYLAGHEHLFEVTPPMRQRRPCSPEQGGVIHMTSGAAGRLSQVEIPHPSYPRWAALARHHYVRFDWVERHQVLHYTVKDTHGTVVGYGTIPARASPCSASWTTGDHSSAGTHW